MDFFKHRKQANQLRFEKQLKAVDQQTEKIHTAKKRLVDLYADGESRNELGKLEFRIKGHLSRIGGVKIERRPYASTQAISRREYNQLIQIT